LFLLSRVQMRRIERFFPLSHGIARVDDRRIVSAIVFVIKNWLRCCPSTIHPGAPPDTSIVSTPIRPRLPLMAVPVSMIAESVNPMTIGLGRIAPGFSR
jgi:hypothetical protein